MIIGMGSHKGGVGKSTTACNMAAVLAQSGKTVAIVDTDPNGSSALWVAARSEKEHLPTIHFTNAPAGKTLLNIIGVLNKSFHFVIVDVAGADDSENDRIYMLCDKIIFPFSPSQLDLNTLPSIKEFLDEQSELKEQGALAKVPQAHFLLTRIPTTNKKEEEEAITFCKEFGINPMKARIRDRKIFRETMGMGLGVIEAKDEKATGEILDLIKELLRDSSDVVRQRSVTSAKRQSKSDGKGAQL